VIFLHLFEVTEKLILPVTHDDDKFADARLTTGEKRALEQAETKEGHEWFEHDVFFALKTISLASSQNNRRQFGKFIFHLSPFCFGFNKDRTTFTWPAICGQKPEDIYSF